MNVATTTARPHSFHIPVMGTGFTIDTPLRVAQWGIASAISLVDDDLIEQVRLHHAARLGRPAEPISSRDEDARARRITAYLDLLHDEVERQVEDIRASPFEPGSSIERYFSMLPPGPLSRAHRALRTLDGAARTEQEAALRRAVVPGAIEANIMTKIDRRLDARGNPRPTESSDALAAVRGVAAAKGPCTLVLSAGLNPRLCGYMGTLDAFFSKEGEIPDKGICLKVSDFRSAQVQCSYFAKRGLWVSEYRVESGLNCGGHAFPTAGLLMGPILEKFQRERDAMIEKAFADWTRALESAGRFVPAEPPPVRVTAQGGIGTAEEATLLHDRYGVDGTGWGSPFLLVEEVTRVDAVTRERLLRAGPDDIERGPSSPLGVPFWTLTTSDSERARRARIQMGRPGSPCPKGYLALQLDDAGKPVCPASRAHLRQRTQNGEPSADELRKACICHDLAGGAMLELGLCRDATPAVCPGPNLVNFREVLSLEQMVDHIYGTHPRALPVDRQHVFIAELDLYLDELEERYRGLGTSASAKEWKTIETWTQNLLDGVDHYRGALGHLAEDRRVKFAAALDQARDRLSLCARPSEPVLADLSA